MLAHWVTDDGEMHHAKWRLSTGGTMVVIHLQVESLGDYGWDWNVWESSGCVQQRYGLAGTLDEAKAKAESTLGCLVRELSLLA